MSEFIEQYSHKTSERLAEAKMIDKEDISIYAYNLQVLTERTIAFLGVFIIAGILGYLLETVVFVIAFSLIREFVGGYHCKTFLGCFFLSVITILLSVPMVYFFVNHLYAYMISVIMSTAYILFVGTTSNTEDGFTDKEICLVKRMGRYMCLLVTSVSMLAYQFQFIRQLSLYIGVSVIQVAFYLIIARIKQRRKSDHEECIKQDAA